MEPSANGKYLEIDSGLLEKYPKNKILTIDGFEYIRVEQFGTHNLKSRMKPKYVCNEDVGHVYWMKMEKKQEFLSVLFILCEI